MRALLVMLATLTLSAYSSAGDWDRLNACAARGLSAENCPRTR